MWKWWNFIVELVQVHATALCDRWLFVYCILRNKWLLMLVFHLVEEYPKCYPAHQGEYRCPQHTVCWDSASTTHVYIGKVSYVDKLWCWQSIRSSSKDYSRERKWKLCSLILFLLSSDYTNRSTMSLPASFMNSRCVNRSWLSDCPQPPLPTDVRVLPNWKTVKCHRIWNQTVAAVGDLHQQSDHTWSPSHRLRVHHWSRSCAPIYQTNSVQLFRWNLAKRYVKLCQRLWSCASLIRLLAPSTAVPSQR